MNRPAVAASAFLGLTVVLSVSTAGRAQGTVGAQAVVDALRANPLTLPYDVQVTPRDGAIVLSGRVGTKAVHDAVVQTVVNLGLVPHDDLVIDTTEAQRVAARLTPPSPPYLVYPPPLFGRLDNPFWGFEPPLLSYPPGAVRPAPRIAPSATAARPSDDDDSVKGRVRLVVDAAGQVFLTGEVATEKDRREIEQGVRDALGGAEIVSRLEVAERAATPPPPPPPPEPMIVPPVNRKDQAPPNPARLDPDAPSGRDDLARRVTDALGRRPALKGEPVVVETRGGVVAISGKVSSAFEAMLAYRAVEQTPGVREIIDNLEFPVPDEDHPNPLKGRARPDDLEPYLTYQVRRHVGDSAHVDRVRVRGEVVEIHAAAPGEDQARIVATLRSIPLLRDFRIDPRFARD